MPIASKTTDLPSFQFSFLLAITMLCLALFFQASMAQAASVKASASASVGAEQDGPSIENLEEDPNGDHGVDNAHGISLLGDLKYEADFEHLDYVNANAPKGGTMSMAQIGTFDSLNPFITRGVPAAGISLIYQTLMTNTADEVFSEYGLIAETVTMPADRSFVEFKLRDEARWHDGKAITPEDVIWSFETLIEKGNPFYRAYYANVNNVKALEGNRVRFEFDAGVNRELPLIIGQMPILPKHYYADKEFDNTTLEAPLGSGPYKVKSLEAGQKITYARVEDWWAAELPIVKGRYNFDEIEFIYFRDDTVALQAFLSGDIDVRLENTAKSWATAYVGEAVKDGRVVLAEIPHERPTGMQGFVYNTRRPVFQDKAVRKALAYAFDFDWSNEKFAYGAYTRTHSYFSNSELASYGVPEGRELEILQEFEDQLPAEVFEKEYMPPSTDGSGNNRALLREGMQILDKAGWSLGPDRIRSKDGVRLSFEIITQNPAFERWFSPFIQNLRKMGVEANLRVLDTAQYSNRMNDFDYDMTIGVFGQSNSPGNEQRDYWHSDKADMPGSRNIIGIQNPVIDALVEKVIAAPNREELVYRTRALDRVLLSHHYLIPNWHINVWRVAYWEPRLSMPDVIAPYDLGVLDTWWADQTSNKQQ